MKKHLAITSALLAILLMIPGAFAQSSGGKAGKSSKASGVKKSSAHADAQLATLSQQLNLTEDQKSKIKPIVDDTAGKLHLIKKDATLSKDDQKAQSKAARAAGNDQIRAILTPDQQKTFDGLAKKGKKKDAA